MEWGEPVQSKFPFGTPVVVIMQAGERTAGEWDRKFNYDEMAFNYDEMLYTTQHIINPPQFKQHCN